MFGSWFGRLCNYIHNISSGSKIPGFLVADFSGFGERDVTSRLW